MQFTIYRDKLKDAIGKLRASLATASANPVLEHFLFEIKNKMLTMKSTNINITTVWETSVETDLDFSFTLPGATLAGLITSLDQEKVTFHYNKDTQDVTLKCGKYEWEAISGDVASFPTINIPSDLKIYELPQNFTHMLRTVFFSISSDTSKPDLNSLCIDINKDSSGKMSLISTDRIRLSCADSATSFNGEAIRFIIPRTSVSEILKLEPTCLMYTEDLKDIYFKTEEPSGKYVLRTSLTNAKYPDIYAYLNSTFSEKEVKIKKLELIRALKRIKVTSDKVDKIGTVEFSKSKVVISSRGQSSKSKEEIMVDIGDMDTPTPFNIKLDLMLEYLNEESNDTVLFKIVNNMCLVFDKESYRHVLSIER